MSVIKIDKSKKYHLLQDGEVLLGPCDHLMMEAEDVCFVKVGEEQKLYNVKSKKELDLTGLFPHSNMTLWFVVDENFGFSDTATEELGRIAVVNNVSTSHEMGDSHLPKHCGLGKGAGFVGL